MGMSDQLSDPSLPRGLPVALQLHTSTGAYEKPNFDTRVAYRSGNFEVTPPMCRSTTV
jgi:hypothetical protein